MKYYLHQNQWDYFKEELGQDWLDKYAVLLKPLKDAKVTWQTSH